MPREYRHIKQYENELLDLRNQSLTYKEIADRMGFSKKQIQKFFERYRINQRKINAGQTIHKKGRPCKNADNGIAPSIQKLDKLAQMRYVMSRRGNPYDNALAENFFSILKTECIHRIKLSGYDEARLIISEYINFYNNYRIQTKTKLTPLEKRNQFVV